MSERTAAQLQDHGVPTVSLPRSSSGGGGGADSSEDRTTTSLATRVRKQ